MDGLTARLALARMGILSVAAFAVSVTPPVANGVNVPV